MKFYTVKHVGRFGEYIDNNTVGRSRLYEYAKGTFDEEIENTTFLLTDFGYDFEWHFSIEDHIVFISVNDGTELDSIWIEEEQR